MLTFTLEGRLEGPWVAELQDCWKCNIQKADRATFRVDLAGVTFLDAIGRAALAEIHERRAVLVASDCLTKAIIDPDRAAAKRAFDAMMTMRKIDIAAIEAARRG